MLENGFNALWQSMGIPNLVWGQLLMAMIGGLLIYLAIRKGFEPLLLLPIGFGCILANVPVAGLAEDGVGQLLLAAAHPPHGDRRSGWRLEGWMAAARTCQSPEWPRGPARVVVEWGSRVRTVDSPRSRSVQI